MKKTKSSKNAVCAIVATAVLGGCSSKTTSDAATSSSTGDSTSQFSAVVSSSIRSSVSASGTNKFQRGIQRISKNRVARTTSGSNKFAGKKYWLSKAGSTAPDPTTATPDGTVGSDGSISGVNSSSVDTILTVEDPNTSGVYIKALIKPGADGMIIDPISFGQYQAAVNSGLNPESSASASGSGMASALENAANKTVVAADIDDSMAQVKSSLESCASDTSTSLKACTGDVVGQSSSLVSDIKMAAAKSQGWSAGSVMELIARSQFTLRLDSFIYAKFGEQLGSALGTDFVTQARTYINGLIQRGLDGTDGSDTVQVRCRASYSKYHGGGEFVYKPTLATNSSGVSAPSCANAAEIAKNFGLDANSSAVTAYLSAISSGSNNPVQIGTVACSGGGDVWNQAGYFCAWPPSLEIKSKITEANRNDPDGSHPRPGGGGDGNEVGMIGITSKFQSDLMADSNTATCMPNAGGNGNPSLTDSAACTTWFNSFIASHKSEFTGIFGYYAMLNSPELFGGADNLKLSLNDLHTAFAGSNYLNSRVAAWTMNATGRQMGSGGNSTWVPPVLAYSSGKFLFQDVFNWNFTPSSGTLDQAIQAAITASSLPYDYTFKQFENIPTMDEIKAFVFGSSHHEDWNPFGSRYFWAAQDKQTGKPVFCRLLSKSTNKPLDKELSSDTKLDCLTDLTQLAVNSTDSLWFTGADNYPYVLLESGWRGDDKGRIYTLGERKTGRQIQYGGSQFFIIEMNSGNPEQCTTSTQDNTVVEALLSFGWGSDRQESAVSALCANLSNFENSGTFRWYQGGTVEVSGDDGHGNKWKWDAPQIGVTDTTDTTHTINPVCYYASATNIATNSVGQVDSSTSGATISSTTGELTALGTGGSIDLCSNSSIYNALSQTQYYLVMMGQGSDASTRTGLKAFFLSNGTRKDTMRYRDWQNGDTQWESTLLWIGASTIETALGAHKLVAPASAPVFLSSMQLRNVKHDPKFDPFCDDIDGNGKCDCYIAGTTTKRSNPDDCTLLDDAAEPTMSQPLYWSNQANASDYAAFFTSYGGKGGADLAGLDGNYMNTHQLYLPMDQAFQCQYKVTGETTYRRPDFVRWDGFYKNHPGCPGSDGTIVALQNMGQGNESGGGPVRLANPKPMKNAFDVEYPNTMMSLISLATASTGQGVAVDPTARVFGLDSSLAMIALRAFMPTKITVYDSTGTNVIPDASPMLSPIRTNNGSDMNALAAIQGIIKAR